MANYRHGLYGTPTYKSWSEMKDRCRYPHHSRGHYEGVTYCEEWESFDNFVRDMGIRPEGTTLDRIDCKGNYEPSNCRWADILTQANNRSNNVYYDIDGERLTLSQIARKYGLNRSNLANKIYLYKWDIATAVAYLLDKKGVRSYR